MSARKLPDITHLQFLVLGRLLDEEQAGRVIREELSRFGVRGSAPAFYQMMARLEESALVEGWYDQQVIDGQIIKERRYRATKAGAAAWKATRAFYLAQAEPARRRKRFADG
jgi:hypothetical protein